MEDQPAIHEVAQRIQPELAATGALGPIPLEWLHMTMQGVGFTDEVSEETLAEIAEAVSQRVSGIEPVPVTLGPPVVDPEGVNLPVQPSEAVDVVRRAVRAGIADVWGKDRVPEAETGFAPHVSLAYSHTSGMPLTPIRDMLEKHVDAPPAVLTRVSLIDINRDNGVYQWRLLRRVSLGAADRIRTAAEAGPVGVPPEYGWHRPSSGRDFLDVGFLTAFAQVSPSSENVRSRSGARRPESAVFRRHPLGYVRVGNGSQ